MSDTETQAIERATAEGFLVLYNAKHGSAFRIVKVAGPGETPDVECKDSEGRSLLLEITMTEDNSGDIQAALGRSEHKDLASLRALLQKVRAGEAKLPINCLSENVKALLVQRLRRKFQKRYGLSVALVVRETTGVDWDWDLVLPEIREALSNDVNPFDQGVWLLSRSKERVIRVF